MSVYPKMKRPTEILEALNKAEQVAASRGISNRSTVFTPLEGALHTLRWIMGVDGAIDLGAFLGEETNEV